MKIISRLLQKILPYNRIVWLAKKRQRYRWRRNKGSGELAFLNWLRGEAVKYITYFSILTGASVGIRLLPFIPPEIFDRIFEWYPRVGDWMLWLSDNLTKEIIFWIMFGYLVGNIFMRVIYYFFGMWFEKSGWERVEQLSEAEQFKFFETEKIVKPLERLEKRLGTKKDKKVGEKTK